MSTPSTATVTMAPHHQYYSHHQAYQPTSLNNYHINNQMASRSSRLANLQYQNGFTNSQCSSDLRKKASINGQRQAHSRHSLTASQYTPEAPRSVRKLERTTDWNEFYRNGIPKEVIVIDDDDDDDDDDADDDEDDDYYDHDNESQSQLGHSSRATAAMNDNSCHAAKRRKTIAVGPPNYDTSYQCKTSYSTNRTSCLYESPSNKTISTDRTTSALNTTAATSLGSQASKGSQLPFEGSVSQKRKRTRKAVLDEANEAKRREIARGNAYEDYYPPPNPPIKANDVYVQVIHDRSYSRDQKIDDDHGHYMVTPDTDLTDRYQIIKLLGQGTFGKVVEAYDRQRKTKCAIKVIRSVQKYRDASRIELRVLSSLAANDPHNRNKCIHIRDSFDFRNHICIVTDLFGQSVFDFLKSNQFVPFPSTHIQKFARQLFTSVAFLHELQLIHTDLKPENILLVNNNYQTFTYNRQIPSSSKVTNRSARHRKVLLDPEIRLIDFGSATFNDEYHSSVVSTRHYRAPEIILNLGWSYPCDIWSIGCILVEFFTGDALFQTHDNLEHLAMMEPICGGKIEKLERDMIKSLLKPERSSRNPASQYFKAQRLDYPQKDTARASKKYVKNMKNLEETIPPNTEFNRHFLDLLNKIFVYNPGKRLTAKQALDHPWFKQSMQDDGTEAGKIAIEREKKTRAKEQERVGHFDPVKNLLT